MGRESLALEKLHTKEVNFPAIGFRGVNLVHQADVRVPYFECTLQFGREQALEAGLCGLNCNPGIALPVNCFINHTHATFADGTHDLETALYNLTGLKRAAHYGESDEWILQKTTHALFPLQRFGEILVNSGVCLTRHLQKSFTFYWR